MKKGGLLFVGLFLFVFLSSGIFAEQVCSIVPKAQCSADNTLMKVSDLTNSHGEVSTLNNYAYAVCCNFAGSTQCEVDGSNKVIGLSSTTNAHAEVPLLTNYATDVCYGDLSCISSTDECGTATAANYPLGILSLSASTNAHIGNTTDYTTKICCNSPTMSSAYWSKNGNTAVSVTDAVPGTTELKMVVKNLEASTAYDFEIWERDSSDDDEITTKSGTTDVSGKAIVSWIITQTDLDEGADGEDLEEEEFYFKVLNAGNLISTSGNLEIGTIYNADFCESIQFCDAYAEENNCIEDVCAVATFSVGNFSCDPLAGESCYCNWDSEDSTCAGVAETLIFDENGTIQGSGQCIINAGESSDDCADGKIVYSWTGTWVVDGEEVKICDSGDENCESCLADGTQEIQCPSLVQLPFFGTYNLIVAGLLITLIYVIFNLMERKKKSSKSKKRR